jgi:lysophospholipase L1-like esterase
MRGRISRTKLLSIAFISLILLSGFMMLLLATVARTANAQGPIRVACVGDSITAGSGYPASLQRILGNNYAVGNFGVSGSAVSSNSNKPYMSQPAFWSAMNFEPDVIVIMLGTNDAKMNDSQNLDDFQGTYMNLISKFQELPGDQQIILVDPPPILNNTLNLSDENLVQGVIPQIAQVATSLNLTTVDVYSALTNHTEVFGDGVHPNSEGGQIIAEKINQIISANPSENAPPEFP